MYKQGKDEYDEELKRFYTPDDIQRLINEWYPVIHFVEMLESKFVTLTFDDYCALSPALKTYITTAHNEMNKSQGDGLATG